MSTALFTARFIVIEPSCCLGEWSSPAVVLGRPPPIAGFTVIELSCCLGKWSSPAVVLGRPPPMAGSTLTKINENQAVLFGGRDSRQFNPNLYMLELDTMVGRLRISEYAVYMESVWG